jgi:hypothetical protein
MIDDLKDLSHELASIGFIATDAAPLVARTDTPVWRSSKDLSYLSGLNKISDWSRLTISDRQDVMRSFYKDTDRSIGLDDRVISLAARVAKGSHLVIYDIDQHDRFNKYDLERKHPFTKKERFFQTCDAIDTIASDLLSTENAAVYIERATIGESAHVYALLRFDPSIASLKYHAKNVEKSSGCQNIDVFCAGIKTCIAVPGSRRYAMRYMLTCREKIAIHSWSEIDTAFHKMRENPCETRILRSADEEPIDYSYTRRPRGTPVESSSDVEFGPGGRQEAMIRTAFNCIRQGQNVTTYTATIDSLDKGSRDIRSWRARGTFEKECAALYSWCLSRTNFTSCLKRSAVPENKITFDISYSRDMLDDDESELLDLAAGWILGDRLTAEATRKAKNAAWEILSFALSKKKYLEDTKRRYVGRHAFLNSGVLLDISTLQRVGATRGLSHADVRNGVTILKSLGMLGSAVVDDRTGRTYSYRGQVRFATHRAAYLPSEALSKRLGSVMLFLVKRSSSVSWEASMPIDDASAKIVDTSILDAKIDAARFLAADRSLLKKIALGNADEIDRFTMRDVGDSLLKLDDSNFSLIEKETLKSGVMEYNYDLSNNSLKYNKNVDSKLLLPVIRIYNAFGDLDIADACSLADMPSGPPI